MKKFLLQAFAVAFCLGSGVFVASCDDDNNPVDNPPIDGETAYVVAATTGEASYLVPEAPAFIHEMKYAGKSCPDKLI